jgi:hypothetical protein
MSRALALASLTLTLTLACGGADAPAGEALGSFTSSVEIPSGMTMTIAPGARLTAGPGATLTVRGVLVVRSAGTPARIAPAAGGTWVGIVVASGGALDATGLDLDDADTAVSVEVGAASASYAGGTIARAEHPFQVARGAALEVRDATVLEAKSSSGIAGAFEASRLDYQKSGAAGGLIMNDATATFDVVDSTFRGTADAGGDYIISYGAQLVRVAYSTITGAHCAFHFNDVARFEIDHVTSGDSSPGGPGNQVAWGAMLYGSGAGPNVIKDSNFLGSDLNLEQLGTNGPLTITNTFTTGKNEPAEPSWTWAVADVAAAPILDAKPR